MDPTILDGFNRIGDFDQLAGRGFGIGVGAIGGEFHDGLGSRRRFIVNSILEHCRSRQSSTWVSNRSLGYFAKYSWASLRACEISRVNLSLTYGSRGMDVFKRGRKRLAIRR